MDERPEIDFFPHVATAFDDKGFRSVQIDMNKLDLLQKCDKPGFVQTQSNEQIIKYEECSGNNVEQPTKEENCQRSTSNRPETIIIRPLQECDTEQCNLPKEENCTPASEESCKFLAPTKDPVKLEPADEFRCQEIIICNSPPGKQEIKQEQHPGAQHNQPIFSLDDRESLDVDPCKICDGEYKGIHPILCPVHGLLIGIKSENAVSERNRHMAANALPNGLIIKQSTIRGAGRGVWTTEPLSKGLLFGPCKTQIKDARGTEDDAASLQDHEDASDSQEESSYWIEFVKSTSSEEQHNLVAFWYGSQLFYSTVRSIPANTELLTQCNQGYDADLNRIATIVNMVKSNSNDSGNSGDLLCTDCNSVFESETMFFKHHKKEHAPHIPIEIYLLIENHKQGRNEMVKTSNRKLSESDHDELESESLPAAANIKTDVQTQECCLYHEYQRMKSFDEAFPVGLHVRFGHVNDSDTIISNVENIRDTSDSQFGSNKTGECPLCCKGYMFKDLKRHMKLHSKEQTYKCDVCDKFFKNAHSVQSHMKVHNGKATHVCPQCGKWCNSSSELKVHIRVHTEEQPYRCQDCGKGFKTFSSHKLHMRIHTGEKPYKCSSHVCPQCGKWCNSSSELKVHIRVHTGEQPYKCQDCGKGFKTFSSHKLHMRIHTGEKQYKCSSHVCPQCGKWCNSSSELKVHIRVHTGEQPYKCQDCGKGFKTFSSHKLHMRIHTGEKPYKCSICGKRFSRQNNFKTHLFVHTGKKPFSCSVCGKTFGRTNILQTHMRCHTGEEPFKCKNCEKTFKQLSSLKRHMLGHTGENPHKCPTCGKGFKQSHHVKKHMKTHTRKRPHKCPNCRRGFSTPDDLQTHIKTHKAE